MGGLFLALAVVWLEREQGGSLDLVSESGHCPERKVFSLPFLAAAVFVAVFPSPTPLTINISRYRK